MGVIIHEFEAIAESPAPMANEQPAANEAETRPEAPDPMTLAAALHELAEQAARVWAH
jgi:hypothetical protein